MTSPTAEYETGDGRLIKVSEIVQVYREGVNKSVPTQGKIQRIGNNFFSLTSRFSTVDCDSQELISTIKVYSLMTKQAPSRDRIESVRCVSDAHETIEIASATSENGRFLARLKAPPNGGKELSFECPKKQLLEIWDRSKLIKTIDLLDVDSHGPICVDPQFSEFVWCPSGDQDKLLYVSQRKRPKPMSFLKDACSARLVEFVGDDNINYKMSRPLSPTDPVNVNRGEEYVKREDWGECLAGIEHTIVAILDVARDCAITTIDVEGFSLSNPHWLDNGSKIVSIAYREGPRRLGIIYCNNRDSKIMIHDWQSSKTSLVLQIAAEKECFHTLSVNHAGDKFVYLGSPKFGAHRHSVKLYIYDLRNRTVKNLIDMRSDMSGINEFFILDLPQNCFTTNDRNILFVTSDHLYNHMCLYNIEQSKLTRIKFPTSGMSILEFKYDIILAAGSDINVPPTLFVGALNSLNNDAPVAWHRIEDYVHLNEVEYEAHEIPTEDKSSFISALLIGPNLRELRARWPGSPKSMLIADPRHLPTVVILHGGPHTAFVCNYFSSLVFYARLGLKVLLVNYRGSSGVNEDYIQSLCGNIGQLDVGDCLHAIRYFVNHDLIDPTKLIVQGGSHGGFIACHLSCQEEFKFTSAIIRNPVVDISSLHATSDLPDWSYTEALGHQHYDFSWTPGSQELVRMFECSPMSKCSKANVPTLMLLGRNDQRVKMFQGERWVDVLRARGIETLCKVYTDKHDLGKVDATADSCITAAIWILGHLPRHRAPNNDME